MRQIQYNNLCKTPFKEKLLSYTFVNGASASANEHYNKSKGPPTECRQGLLTINTSTLLTAPNITEEGPGWILIFEHNLSTCPM